MTRSETGRGGAVLVTGGSGFLGRHVVSKLRQLGYARVHAPRASEYDLTKQPDARRLMHDVRPETVIHLAARVGGIGANQRHPGRFIYENLLMGAHVLEESRLAGVRKVLSVGTVCSYPKYAPTPFKEESIWDGYPEETNAPYGIAKRVLLEQSRAYRSEYDFKASVVFPANLYGPGDNLDPETSHVVPAIISKLLYAVREGLTEVTLWGDGTPTRDLLYVEDAAAGIVAAAERYEDIEPMNLGTGVETGVSEVAGLIAQLCGYRGKIVYDGTKPNGQPRRVLDTAKAARVINWRAETSLRDGLARTIEWVDANLAARR